MEKKELEIKRPNVFKQLGQMSRRRRNLAFRSVLGYIIGWIVAGCAVVFLISSDSVRRPLWIVALLGIPTGLLSAYFEMQFAPRIVRNLSIAEMLVVRTLFYALLVTSMVTIYVALSIKWTGDYGSIWDVISSDDFKDRISGQRFYLSIILYVITSALINFARQIRRMLGNGMTTKLLFGRYAKPRAEERLFMFLDLKSSVNISERLGPEQFNRFKNDFFHDIVEPILVTGGEIYQYVGDEVVITWPLSKGMSELNFARCYWDIYDIVQVNSERYNRRYKVIPEFRAGVSGGKVVTAEIGDLKKDIVYSGDPVNLGARLEGKAKELGVALLADERVVQGQLASEFSLTSRGQFELKGFAEPISIVSIEAGDRI